MTAVVGVQALLFQDGGLLVMGANIFNMGILTAAIGFGLYRLVIKQKLGVRLTVAGIGSWIATMAAALIASLQLWLSSTTRLEIVIPAMLGVHALIGIGEALITVAAISFIERTRPDLLDERQSSSSGGRGWIFAGLAVSLFAILISPYASGNPDGLERVAQDLGFLEASQGSPYNLFHDYSIPFLGDTGVSTVIAGVVGVIVVFGLLMLVGRNIRGSKES